jgi:acyl transferase domain-containing protein
VTYVETHGTGTALGDPIEIAALTQAFHAGTERKHFCAIGSVKTNIGHLDAAAGVTGLIKTVLALKYKQIPPSLHFERPNPNIDFAHSPFYVNDKLAQWSTANGIPRRAGVSSFGIGGTNAHVIVEEAPQAAPSTVSSRPYQLLLLSARTDTALTRATENLARHLKANPKLNIADVAYTLQVGRGEFASRSAILCRDTEDAIEAFDGNSAKRVRRGKAEPGGLQLAMMFSGQGAQYVGMGRDLYRSEQTFHEQVERCAKILEPHLGLNIRKLIFAAEADAAEEQLKQTAITQPALFVIEYALAQLWMEWGIKPSAMIGHSIGEYVAACLAGVFSLEDALRLVVARGRLMQSLPPGAMLSVPLAESELTTLLATQGNRDVSLAAINAPSLCVVSGTVEAVDSIQHELSERGVECRRLHTSHAFHSQKFAVSHCTRRRFHTSRTSQDAGLPQTKRRTQPTGHDTCASLYALRMESASWSGAASACSSKSGPDRLWRRWRSGNRRRTRPPACCSLRSRRRMSASPMRLSCCRRWANYGSPERTSIGPPFIRKSNAGACLCRPTRSSVSVSGLTRNRMKISATASNENSARNRR